MGGLIRSLIPRLRKAGNASHFLYLRPKFRIFNPMGLKCGIVGLPNVGKSTLFNAISNNKAEAANFPFCTIEPNVGVISVPDNRLRILEALVKP